MDLRIDLETQERRRGGEGKDERQCSCSLFFPVGSSFFPLLFFYLDPFQSLLGL